MTNTPNNKPKIFELETCSLFTPVEDKKKASLSWSLRERYPRLSVFTRTQSDMDGRGVVQAAFDLETFGILLDQWERLIRGKEAGKSMINVMHYPRDENKKITGDKEMTSEVWFGKDEEGFPWIAVHQPNRPKLQFKTFLSGFHELHFENGRKLTEAEGAQLRALGIIRILRQAFITEAATFRDTSIPRTPSGPYSTRGQNNSEQQPAKSSYGGGNDTSFLDEDIPY